MLLVSLAGSYGSGERSMAAWELKSYECKGDSVGPKGAWVAWKGGREKCKEVKKAWDGGN